MGLMLPTTCVYFVNGALGKTDAFSKYHYCSCITMIPLRLKKLGTRLIGRNPDTSML